MEFPTIDEFTKNVAEKVLDEITYGEKTIREWIEIIIKQQPCEDCISRQAVINRIANTCFWLSADDWNELIECINSISPVTPAEKQQTCKDCVSREAVIDLVADYDLHMGQVVRGIHALPPVIPSRPKGTWIDDNCSICGYGVKSWNNTPYCPNCGARMTESGE